MSSKLKVEGCVVCTLTTPLNHTLSQVRSGYTRRFRSVRVREEFILGISMGPKGFPWILKGMGITKLVSWECECEREWLDGNERE